MTAARPVHRPGPSVAGARPLMPRGPVRRHQADLEEP
ncbi:hypothetical protein GA0115249_116312 [Streptomyces sp. PpalLS-921]|nr:hypothetical protein GA0115249_116312 [Streptomyces sp. PpalLS-921]